MEVRKRTLTEKGRLYELSVKQKQRKALENRIREKVVLIESLLMSSTVLSEVPNIEKAFEEVDKAFQSFMSVHSNCQALMESEDEASRVEDNRTVEVLERQVQDLKKQFYERTRDDSESQRTKQSKRSCRSSKSSLREKALLEKVKLAELQLEGRYLQQRRTAEIERKDAEMKAELLKRETEIEAERLMRDAEIKSLQLVNEFEIAKAEAKLKVLSDIEEKSSRRSSLIAESVDKTQYVETYVKLHQKHPTIPTPLNSQLSANAEPYHQSLDVPLINQVFKPNPMSSLNSDVQFSSNSISTQQSFVMPSVPSKFQVTHSSRAPFSLEADATPIYKSDFLTDRTMSESRSIPVLFNERINPTSSGFYSAPTMPVCSGCHTIPSTSVCSGSYFIPNILTSTSASTISNIPLCPGPFTYPYRINPTNTVSDQSMPYSSLVSSISQAQNTIRPDLVERPIVTSSSNLNPDNTVSVSKPLDPEQTLTVNTMQMFAEMIGYLQAPNAELDVFSGNPLEFEYFLAMFVESVEKRISDPRSRLTRLLKFLTGEAKELVKGCIHLPPSEGYQYAKRLLQKHFGDPYKVTSKYLKELKDWPRLKTNPDSFRHFYAFLVKFQSNMKCYQSTNYDSLDLLQIVLRKLPTYVQTKWNRHALALRRSGQEPKLQHLIQYVEDETILINDPMFSHDALFEQSKQQTDVKSKNKLGSYGTKADIICPMCECNHDLDMCPGFKKLNIFDRRKFLFKCRLCFACYGKTTEGHSAKTCPNPRSCSMCKERHPTGLHGYVKPKGKKDSLSNNCISNNSSSASFLTVSLCVVPVKLRHANYPDKVIHTFALLDNGSQGSFVCEDIIKSIGASGVSTSLSLKTLHGERIQNCELIDGLYVSSVSSEDYVKLPRCYTQASFPVNIEDVPTVEKLSHWNHLSSILHHLPKSVRDFKIGVLIGGNCPKALEPISVISSRDGGPFAFESRLGWCVAGPMDKTSPRMSINSLFLELETLKDNSLKETLQAMYEHDFNERREPNDSQFEGRSFSQDEKRFISIMNDKCKFVNGKYVMPLPFRNQNSKMPNNRFQALQRACYLKKRLMKDDRMCNDYKDFMSKLFANGHAVYVDPSETKSKDGDVWYIPHHGVYHPRKPNKIRVVFDCSSQWKGVSLNNMLLQGPDLTNQLVGVLTRFRQDYVVIVGDIEKMFYQVRVEKKYQDFLRFLWWPDGDFDKQLVECRMTVHLFGAISSPSVSNFALRRTAADNASKYDCEVSQVLEKGFLR